MPRFLKELTVHEVSSVDRGAGEGVKILLMKRLEKSDSDPIAKAHAAFNRAVASIMADKTVIDKSEAIAETQQELTDYLAKLAEQERTDMPAKTEAEIQKAIDDAVAAGVATATKKLEGELALAKMSDVHKSYATECKLEGEHLAAFVGKTAEQRDAFMKEFPPKKKPTKGVGESDADCEKSAIDKALEPLVAQNKELQKRLDAADEKEAIVKFAKRAKDLGLAEADGEIMRKAYSGDVEAQGKLDEKLKALATQVSKGGLFVEKGQGGGAGAGASAYDQLVAKGQEIRKSAGDKPMTEAEAFTKAYTDPANAELVQQHKAEEAAKRQAA